MKKTVLVYKSKYGSTGKYAKWIADKLNCDIFEADIIDKNKLLGYDVIIFGGGLYASGINGISLITKNFAELKDKELIVFTVGLADPQIKEQFTPIIDKNFNDEMKEKIKIFHLRGGIDYKKLGFVHKTMMAMLMKMVKKHENKTEEEQAMIDTYGSVVDFSDINSIEPLVNYVTSL